MPPWWSRPSGPAAITCRTSWPARFWPGSFWFWCGRAAPPFRAGPIPCASRRAALPAASIGPCWRPTLLGSRPPRRAARVLRGRARDGARPRRHHRGDLTMLPKILDLASLRDLYRAGRLTPLDLAEAIADRMAAYPDKAVYTTPVSREALRAAAADLMARHPEPNS